MNRRRALIAVGLLAGVPVSRLVAAQAQTEDRQAKQPSYLFVQTAKRIDYKDGVMTLHDVSPQTIYFTDRPDRVVGHLPTDKFVARWTEDKGPDGFAVSPPNAAVTIFNPDGPKTAIVALTNPRYDGKSLAYTVQVLQGIGAAEPGEGVLFIDSYPAWAAEAFSHKY